MSTNYYAILKTTDDLKIKIIEAVIKDQMDCLRTMIPKQIHLGLSASGWPFLFNHNNWEYYSGISGLSDFIDKCEITNEYGTIVSSEEFKNMVETKQKCGIEMYTNSEHKEYYIIRDDYVFSTSTDFS